MTVMNYKNTSTSEHAWLFASYRDRWQGVIGRGSFGVGKHYAFRKFSLGIPVLHMFMVKRSLPGGSKYVVRDGSKKVVIDIPCGPKISLVNLWA